MLRASPITYLITTRTVQSSTRTCVLTCWDAHMQATVCRYECTRTRQECTSTTAVVLILLFSRVDRRRGRGLTLSSFSFAPSAPNAASLTWADRANRAQPVHQPAQVRKLRLFLVSWISAAGTGIRRNPPPGPRV